MDNILKGSIVNKFKNTKLGLLRIKRNLNIEHLTNAETESFVKNIITCTPLESIETKGKNYYFSCFKYNAILTVNSYTFTIITAKKIAK